MNSEGTLLQVRYEIENASKENLEASKDLIKRCVNTREKGPEFRNGRSIVEQCIQCVSNVLKCKLAFGGFLAYVQYTTHRDDTGYEICDIIVKLAFRERNGIECR